MTGGTVADRLRQEKQEWRDRAYAAEAELALLRAGEEQAVVLLRRMVASLGADGHFTAEAYYEWTSCLARAHRLLDRLDRPVGSSTNDPADDAAGGAL